MKMLRNFAHTWGLFTLSPLEQAKRELEQTKRDFLKACAAREAAVAWEQMLAQRAMRLTHAVGDFVDEERAVS